MGLNFKGDPTQMSGPIGDFFKQLSGVSSEKKNAAAREMNVPESQTSEPEKMAKGGKVSSASKRADGCATKGKTRGKVL